MAKAQRAMSGLGDVSKEDVLRANVYRMLAHVLRAPPQRTDLDVLAGMAGDASPLGAAVRSLAHLAARTSPEAVDREYHALFIGVDGGELLPYGSHYASGPVHEEQTRRHGDLARPPIVRSPDLGDAEDHIAALCETMAGLILGRFGEPATVEEQKAFFRRRIGPWAKRFFADLEGARTSIFYAAVGQLGAAFMQIEDAAFELA